jgi:hypothetical protein
MANNVRYYLPHSVDERLLVLFYASMRQRYYNSVLVEEYSPMRLEIAAAVAAVKPQVLMKVMEAVVKARRAYKETQPIEAQSGQQSPSEPEHGGTDDNLQDLEKAVDG